MPAGKHKQVTCGACGKEMRSDKLKVHAAKCKKGASIHEMRTSTMKGFLMEPGIVEVAYISP